MVHIMIIMGNFSNSGLPEYSTCVGFCINVITGYLYDHDKYFEVTDWDNIPDEHPSFRRYFEKALQETPNLDIDLYKSHHRRIRPDEYIAAAYFDTSKIPIRKQTIDSIIGNVGSVISSKRSRINDTNS
jgi:hypothetical protein